MVASEIVDRILMRSDDPSAITSDRPEVLSAVNEGQELAALLSLCLETTATLTLSAGAAFGTLLSRLPDYICPLRLSVGGARLRPGTLADLDGDNEAWQATPGTPARYSTLGWDLYAVTPQPTTDTAAEFIYARSPKVMLETDTPEIPEQYHQSLVYYGKYRVRLKEGAQGLSRGVADLNYFLDAMQALGDWVRARSRAARYDTLPIELALFDRSRLLLKEPKPKPGKKAAA